MLAASIKNLKSETDLKNWRPWSKSIVLFRCEILPGVKTMEFTVYHQQKYHAAEVVISTSMANKR